MSLKNTSITSRTPYLTILHYKLSIYDTWHAIYAIIRPCSGLHFWGTSGLLILRFQADKDEKDKAQLEKEQLVVKLTYDHIKDLKKSEAYGTTSRDDDDNLFTEGIDQGMLIYMLIVII